MLILTRHIGEKVRIGDDITVVIVDAWGQQARIGVDAPRGVPVHRKEVYDLVKQVTTARIRIDRRQFLPSWLRSLDGVRRVAGFLLAPDRSSDHRIDPWSRNLPSPTNAIYLAALRRVIQSSS